MAVTAQSTINGATAWALLAKRLSPAKRLKAQYLTRNLNSRRMA
jgi:hypothetical protein